MYANLKKCQFFTKTVDFLGFIISDEGITMDLSRVDAITEWPIPESYKDIQVFIGFINFYHCFIQGYGQLSTPLTNLLKGSKNSKKKGTFHWDENANQAFHKLRAAFRQAPLLAHFDLKLPI